MRIRYAIPVVVSLTLAIVTAGAIGAGSFYSVAEDARPQVLDYSYGPDPAHNLDLYLPASAAIAKPGQALTPTIVFVHGGSWTGGDKEDMQEAAQAAVDLGYVAISVNYRLAPEHRWPSQRRDVVSALRWIHSHAPDLHVDRSRIVVIGSSAGGEVAASALTQGAGRKLARGLITLSAPVDFALVAKNTMLTHLSEDLAEALTEDLINCTPETCEEIAEKRAVFTKIDANDPPMLIFAGNREWVDPQGAIRLHQVNLASGVPSRLIVFDSRKHGMALFDDAWPIAAAWIAERMAAPR